MLLRIRSYRWGRRTSSLEKSITGLITRVAVPISFGSAAFFFFFLLIGPHFLFKIGELLPPYEVFDFQSSFFR